MKIYRFRSSLSFRRNQQRLADSPLSTNLRKIVDRPLSHLALVIILLVYLLTSVVGYRFYNQPQLNINSVAPETIRAPQSRSFIDWETTNQRKKDIQTAVVPVLQRDDVLTQNILVDLQHKLKDIEKLRKQAGNFPYISANIISTNTQKYLRNCSDQEWNLIKKSLEDRKQSPGESSVNNPVFQKASQELKQAQGSVSLTKLEKIRQDYQKTIEKFAIWSQENVNVSLLLNIEESIWQKLSQKIKYSTKIILTQGLPPGLSEEMLKETIKLHLQEFPQDLQKEGTRFLVNFLKNQSNLKEDKVATQRIAQEAANTVDPLIINVEKGQVIVEAGKKITPQEFTILDGFKLSRRSINFSGLAGSALLVGASFYSLIIVSRLLHRPLRRRDYILFGFLSLSTIILNLLDSRYSSLPAVGLLASSFYGQTLALTEVIWLTGLSLYTIENINWENLISCLISGLVAAIIAGKLRSRDELAILGLCIGLTQGAVYLLIHLIHSISFQATLYVMTPDALYQGLLGLAWAIVAIGLSPYLERMFDLVTPIRLAELSHPNCPLLKRLAKEAPGTFQHTLAVASLAESAARTLNCNVELVRAGTLYHDIGKMHDPQGFIENQKGGINKHDQINDPWTSVEIIKKHVTEGLVIARKYGLPKVIQDFIPEHQGTLLIAYFYFQAKQQGREVNEADFRYAGPIPQCRETAIVMLSDGCEAALRSLKEATPEMALSMVKKILRARWQEEQLCESGLLYEELPIIAEVFVEVWQQFNHSRIAYPRGVLEPPCLGK